jgi:hypothetical protein
VVGQKDLTWPVLFVEGKHESDSVIKRADNDNLSDGAGC